MAPSPITLLDRVRLLFVLAAALCNGWFMLLLRRVPKNKSFLLQFLYGVVRGLSNQSTLGVDRLMNPLNGTEKQYLDFAKRKGIQPDTLVVEGVKAHWVGASNAERVLVYFHGGGYVLPLIPGHLEWLFNWTTAASKIKSTSALVLSYSLAPEAQYPVQLQQAIGVLNHILTKTGRAPHQILIGGDSAGGNLSLAVISHILHPHPRVPQRITLSEPLAGALLLSPWVEHARADALFKANQYTDIIADHALERWAKAYRGASELDNYIQFVDVDESWFKGIESVVGKVWIWAGSIERLIGSINVIAKKLDNVHPKVDYMVEEGAIHIDFYVDATVAPVKPTDGTRQIEQWISSA